MCETGKMYINIAIIVPTEGHNACINGYYRANVGKVPPK